MKALIFRSAGQITCETVPDPDIVDPDDAIVAVGVAGICGSDLHVLHGRETGLDPGTVMGHEFAGEVVAIGSAVRQLRIGDSVTSPFTTSCGRCAACVRGLTSRCRVGRLFGWVEQGAGLHGGQAEFVRVPHADSTLFHVPADLSLEQGLLLGDALATGFYCARRADLEPHGVGAIVGCGPVGLLAIAAARSAGVGTLFAIDRVPSRLALASRFGATPIDLTREDPLTILREATDGWGADGVLEAVGSAAAGRLAWELVRPGGTISVVGVHHEAGFAFTPAEAYDKNITYRVGRCPARNLIPELIDWLRRDRFDPVTIVTHRLPLSRGVEGYRLFDAKQDDCIKVVLSPRA